MAKKTSGLIQKVFQGIVKWYENETTNALKMISRAFGWSLFGILYLCGVDKVTNWYVLAISLLTVDILFLANRKFESSYKTKEFFIKENVTVESMDLYQVLMAFSKLVALILALIFDGIFGYMVFCLVSVPVIASISNYKLFMSYARPAYSPHTSSTMASESMMSQYTPIETTSSSMYHSNTIPNYGASGYDYTGSPSNSPTAIGGMSG